MSIFEVHLITYPEYQTELFGYITNLDFDLNHNMLIRPRPTCATALYGDYPVQPMLTFCITGDTYDVMDYVSKIKVDIESTGIPIIRTKVKAMANNDISNKNELCKDGHYYESHFKVNIASTNDWNKLVILCLPFGAHLFYNPYNKTMTPIVTIRRYTTLNDLEVDLNKLRDTVESNGFQVHSVEKEYSVFDSDVGLDKNWLYKDEPSNFITDIVSNMLFPQSI